MKNLSIQVLTDQSFQDYTQEEIHKAFLEYTQQERPFEQILSICDSLFELLDHQEELPEHLKGVLWHLFKSYSMYKALIEKTPI